MKNSYKCKKYFCNRLFFLVLIFCCVYQEYDRCLIIGLIGLRRWDFHHQMVTSTSVKALRHPCCRNKFSLAFMPFLGIKSYFSHTYTDLFFLRYCFQKSMFCVCPSDTCFSLQEADLKSVLTSQCFFSTLLSHLSHQHNMGGFCSCVTNHNHIGHAVGVTSDSHRFWEPYKLLYRPYTFLYCLAACLVAWRRSRISCGLSRCYFISVSQSPQL